MKKFDDIGFIELNKKEVMQICGGSIIFPYGTLFKWIRRALTLGEVYDACSDVIDGYQACRN